MLHVRLLASILLYPCLILGYSANEKILQNITETSFLIDEAMNYNIILSDCNYNRGDLKRIIMSALRVMEFFQQNLGELVIDAAIGTRIMEAQLNLFHAGHPNIPRKLQKLLITLLNKCKRLSEEIISKFTSKQQTTKERDHLAQTIKWVDDASLWEHPSLGNWRSDKMSVINNTMENMAFQNEVMNEEISDKCTADIFKECRVTDECAKMFLEKMYSQYTLTHQVFYLIFAEKKKCFNDEHFKQKMGMKDPTEFMYLMCEKVWDEAYDIQESNFPFLYKDLLTEQITVCSLVGVTRFLKISWLENILSWQSDVGCYLEPSREVIQEGSKRVKRSDNEVQVGVEKCSVHFTTVALCSMAMHLRYFGDSCLTNY